MGRGIPLYGALKWFSSVRALALSHASCSCCACTLQTRPVQAGSALPWHGGCGRPMSAKHCSVPHGSEGTHVDLLIDTPISRRKPNLRRAFALDCVLDCACSCGLPLFQH